jgi:3-methyladenine DNA glycosylase/8-oxoguanine DNA glycosylase
VTTTTTIITPFVAGAPPGRGADTVRTRLTLPATFNFAWIRSFLTLRRVTSLERWTDDDVYIRSVCIDGTPALLTIRYVTLDRRAKAPSRDDEPRRGPAARLGHKAGDGMNGAAWLEVAFTPSPSLTRTAVRTALTRMFDLDGDLESFIAHVRRDKLLGPLVKRRPHVRLPRLIDPFEGLVRAMLGQQVTVRAASTMTDRFTRQFGVMIGTEAVAATKASKASKAPDTSDTPEAPGALYAFPRPDVIAGAGADALRGIGLTRAKATAIARLAETLASGRLDCARLADLSSDDAQAALVALPGIGPWTASYVRMRVLGDRDAFPAADLGVIKALEALGISRADQVATAEHWRPWRAYAVLHLWESLSD